MKLITRYSHYGRRPFLLAMVILRLLAVSLVVLLEPSVEVLFTSAVLLGFGFVGLGVLPACIMDICDPKYETQFNHAYAWTVVPLAIGAGGGAVIGGVIAEVSGHLKLWLL